jgi:DNA-binding NarL/FixJ family response regulator
MPIKVLLVDDHKIVRQGVQAYLHTLADIKVIAEADSGAAAVRAVEQYHPNVVLMDLEMPGEMDGIDATRQIRKAHPETQVIVVTSHHQDEYIFPAVRAGAISYLLKDVEPDELLRGVRAAARGEAPFSPRAATALLPRPAHKLSPREREVLALVAEGLPNKTVARRLGISEKTVKTHLTSVFTTLGVTDRTAAALWAQRNGLTRS